MQAMSVRPAMGGGLRRHDGFGSWRIKRQAMLMQYTMSKALSAIPLRRHPGIAGTHDRLGAQTLPWVAAFAAMTHLGRASWKPKLSRRLRHVVQHFHQRRSVRRKIGFHPCRFKLRQRGAYCGAAREAFCD